jgi:hypothetical protein
VSYTTAIVAESVLFLWLAWWRGGPWYAAGVVLAVIPAETLRMFSWGGVHHPGAWALASPVAFPRLVAGLVAFWYCTYALIPWVAVWQRVSRRTLVLLGAVLLTGSVVNVVLPVSPPWAAGYPRAAWQFAYMRHLLAGDMQSNAAFPSLHVAMPLAIAVGERSWRWGVYVASVAIVVVVGGEHWVLDVAGAVGLVVLCEVVRAGVGARVPWSAGERQDVRDGGHGGGVAEGAPG